MEKDTKKKNVPAEKDKAERTSLKDYFRGVRTEIKKVVWPTRKELVSYTGVVVFTCVVFAIGFWIVDTGLIFGLNKLLNFSF